VSNVIPGAQVSVWVNEQWRGSADADDTVVSVPVSGLKVEDMVTAQQTLCANMSDMSDAVYVTYGVMTTKVQVLTATIDYVYDQPCSLVVTATDNDNNASVDGSVYIKNTNTSATGVSFVTEFKDDQPLPPAVVKADGYQDANIDWPPPFRLMVISVSPTSAKKGQSVSLTVSAKDQWTHQPVSGVVRIKKYLQSAPGTTSWTEVQVGNSNTPFSYTWPLDYPDGTGAIEVSSVGLPQYRGNDIKAPNLK
jgi:hypothetical protein